MPQNTRFSKFRGSQPLLIYLQRSFFVCSISFICSIHLLFARLVFICSVSFLFAAYFFYLQRTFFVCSVPFLFAAFLFYLQRTFFICSVPFLFAAFRFCLQRFFFVCSLSLVGHRTKRTNGKSAIKKCSDKYPNRPLGITNQTNQSY